MELRSTLWALAAACFLSSCGSGNSPAPDVVAQKEPEVEREPITAHTSADDATRVSMVQLLATPERFDGRRVIVVGYLHRGFESSGLYLHREDHEFRLFTNGLWVNGGCGKSLEYNGWYVGMAGTFDAKGHGHMGLWSAELDDVTECIPLRDASDEARNARGDHR